MPHKQTTKKRAGRKPTRVVHFPAPYPPMYTEYPLLPPRRFRSPEEAKRHNAALYHRTDAFPLRKK